MEEATERLVRLFLESNGFLVKTNEKFKADKYVILEVDIIAVRPKNNSKDKLPNKIIGEVKSWSIQKNLFLEERHKDKFKILFKYRKETEEYIKNKYGKNFKFMIFSRKPSKKQKEDIEKGLKENDISFLSLEEISKKIVEYSKERGYTNDPELQILRLLNLKDYEKID